MSGGHFDYAQYKFEQIACDIEQEILDNDKSGEESWEYANKFSQSTLNSFEDGIKAIRLAYIYTQRIDWLLSGDDGEDNFHKRLKTELEGHNG